MILNIFNNIWNKLTDFSDYCYDFIMDNFGNYFFWIIIFTILLIVAYIAISSFANK